MFAESMRHDHEIVMAAVAQAAVPFDVWEKRGGFGVLSLGVIALLVLLLFASFLSTETTKFCVCGTFFASPCFRRCLRSPRVKELYQEYLSGKRKKRRETGRPAWSLNVLTQKQKRDAEFWPTGGAAVVAFVGLHGFAVRIRRLASWPADHLGSRFFWKTRFSGSWTTRKGFKEVNQRGRTPTHKVFLLESCQIKMNDQWCVPKPCWMFSVGFLDSHHWTIGSTGAEALHHSGSAIQFADEALREDFLASAVGSWVKCTANHSKNGTYLRPRAICNYIGRE